VRAHVGAERRTVHLEVLRDLDTHAACAWAMCPDCGQYAAAYNETVRHCRGCDLPIRLVDADYRAALKGALGATPGRPPTGGAP
jgi:uncharacterized protein (DUF983 family)